MQFFRTSDDYYGVSRITGPQHNLLQLQLAHSAAQPLCCECMDDGERLNEQDVIEQVLAGIQEGNQRFGTCYSVTRIRYLGGDTPPERIYRRLAFDLLERLVQEQPFASAR